MSECVHVKHMYGPLRDCTDLCSDEVYEHCTLMDTMCQLECGYECDSQEGEE